MDVIARTSTTPKPHPVSRAVLINSTRAIPSVLLVQTNVKPVIPRPIVSLALRVTIFILRLQYAKTTVPPLDFIKTPLKENA